MNLENARTQTRKGSDFGSMPAALLAGDMKFYHGKRSETCVAVTVDNKPLDPRFDVWVHTFDGFDWGQFGCGSAQLALALLSDYLGDVRQAAALREPFETTVIAHLPEQGWQLSGNQIRDAIESIKRSVLK